MTNTILLRNDKTLTKTTFRNFYQNEHYADKIQILINDDFVSDDIRSYTVTLFVTLPVEGTSNKAKYLTIDEELYKDRYRIELPVTITLTENVGDVVMYLQFAKTNEDGSITKIVTETINISILPCDTSSGEELEDSESYDVLTRLQEEIELLKENKIDKYYDYDSSTGELQFYADGEETGDEILIDQELQLVNW